MGIFNFLKRKRADKPVQPIEIVSSKNESETPELVAAELPKRSPKLSVKSLFKSKPIDAEELTELLIRADFGVELSEAVVADVAARAKKTKRQDADELRELLGEVLMERLDRPDRGLHLASGNIPYVFLVVGVNGAGKTTTIGKLARWLKDGDWQVTLGAADTFRAAAVDQLSTWAERAEVKIILPEQEGQDPAAVAYRTVQHAIQSGADIAIIDTAGRLQNKRDLMDELGKIRRAIEKLGQVTEVLLVIDGSTGQNALAQARVFSEVAGVTGIVVTKLDGSAKGGVIFAIEQELDIPVKLVGLGEGIRDFNFFEPDSFVSKLTAAT